jgi:hypothetical protein
MGGNPQEQGEEGETEANEQAKGDHPNGEIKEYFLGESWQQVSPLIRVAGGWAGAAYPCAGPGENDDGRSSHGLIEQM